MGWRGNLFTLVVSLVSVVLHLYYEAGELTAFEPTTSRNSACRYHTGKPFSKRSLRKIPGSVETHWISKIGALEDAEHLRDGIFLATSDNRTAWLHDETILGESVPERLLRIRDDPRANPGAIIAVNGDGDAWRLPLVGYDAKDFHPHGLSIFIPERDTPEAKTRGRHAGKRDALFVVNHRVEGDFVERFEINLDEKTGLPVSLSHTRSVKGYQWNDVESFSHDAFFVTNWLGYEKGTLKNKFELYSQMRNTVVQRCAAGAMDSCPDATRGLEKFAMANGIAIHNRTLFVAESIGRQVNVFRLNEDYTVGHKLDTVRVHMGIDNLDVHPATGDIYTAGHPKLITFSKHESDPSRVKAPSQVMKIKYNPDWDKEPVGNVRKSVGLGTKSVAMSEILYKFSGEEVWEGSEHERFSASSVAALGANDDLLIGAVFSRGFLHCPLPASNE